MEISFLEKIFFIVNLCRLRGQGGVSLPQKIREKCRTKYLLVHFTSALFRGNVNVVMKTTSKKEENYV
jgi:hypothetical protein